MGWPGTIRALMLAGLLSASVTPGMAGARSDGAEPRSPGGTEYDIPFEKARREAAGEPKGAGRSRTSRPGGTDSGASGPGGGGPRSGTVGGGPSGAGSALFGAGISPVDSGSGGDVRGGNRSDRDREKRGGGGGGSPGDGRSGPGEAVRPGSIPPLLGAQGSDGAGSWWPALLAAAVLGAGAGFGLLIARLRSRRGGTS